MFQIVSVGHEGWKRIDFEFRRTLLPSVVPTVKTSVLSVHVVERFRSLNFYTYLNKTRRFEVDAPKRGLRFVKRAEKIGKEKSVYNM